MASKNSTLVVNNKNDKRLRAYADSLALYNQGMRDRANLMKTVESYDVDKKAISYFANKQYFKPTNGIKPEKEMSIASSGGGYGKSDSGMINFNTYRRGDGSEIKTEKGSITDRALSKKALLYKKPVVPVTYAAPEPPVQRDDNRRIPGIGAELYQNPLNDEKIVPEKLPPIMPYYAAPTMLQPKQQPVKQSPEPSKYFEGKYQGRVTKRINPGWQEWKDSQKKGIPGYAKGKPGYAAGFSPYMQVGMDVAGGVGSLLATDNKESDQNYASNMLSMAGQGASIGSALGPWGMAAGAAIGGVGGYFMANKQAEKQRLAKSVSDINKNTAMVYDQSNQVKAKYDMKYDANNRVPGLDKGKAPFSAGKITNAMVAPEEVIKDGLTGSMQSVPGTYNPSNPDTVPANLSPGTSVYSNRRDQKLPFGKSTPADIARRAEMVQKAAERTISGRNAGSRIDIETAMLNKKNIQSQMNIMDMNTMINNYHNGGAATQKYDTGKSGIKEYYVLDKWRKPMSVSVSGLSDDEIAKRGYQSRELTNDEAAKLTSGGKRMPSWYRKSQPDTNALSDSATAQFAKDKFENTGWRVQVPMDSVPQYNQNVKYKISDTKITGSGNDQAAAANPEATYGVKIQPKLNIRPSSSSNSAIAASIEKAAAATSESQIWAKMNSISNLNPSEGALPYIKQPAYGGLNVDNTMPAINLPSLAKGIQNGTPTAGAGQGGSKFDWSRLSVIGNRLASLAPIAYNMMNSTPEVAPEIYADYINPQSRYNMSPELAEARKQRNIARYNQAALSSNTGSGMAFASDIYSRGMQTTSDIYAKANQYNAQQRSDYANRYNQFSMDTANERRRVYDVNARNRAAGRKMHGEAVSQLSNYAQIQELMKNQKLVDVLNSQAFQASAGSLSPEQRKSMYDIMARLTGMPITN